MTLPRSLLLSVLLLAAPALAGSAQKAAARAAEADALTDDILKGHNVAQAVSRLHFLGAEEQAADELAKRIRHPDVKVRREIAWALSQLASPDHESSLVTLARDDDGAVRMSAAQGLGRIRSVNSKLLFALLADKSVGVRREAAKALGQQRNPKNGSRLAAAAQAEGEPEARVAMLVAVGQSGDKKSSKALEPFLTNSSESTRFAAAQGLCLLGASSGFEFSKKMLASKDKYERRQALALFEGASAKVASPLLKPLLEDEDKTIAATAARILHQGGEPKMLEWLVMAAWKSNGDDRLAYERQLEELKLTDEQRKKILQSQGVK